MYNYVMTNTCDNNVKLIKSVKLTKSLKSAKSTKKEIRKMMELMY